ncbi:putative polysaccharide biosynthesis protein [Dipodascopsis tothii]|uniref:putative polysaccharide biosynthesis protein n=1 Tax=Dipodascopsis tothii TaxID=44089 RepID=UPI0034CF5120
MATTQFDAENADNLEDIEKQFAVKAVMHAQTYWTMMEKMRGSAMHFTREDDEIYETFVAEFPEYNSADAVDKINEDEMKSAKGKERWRKFMNQFEKRVHDFNFGTLLRTAARAEYQEDTTIFVPRMQFLAIEIARNRHGLNDWIYEDAHK